MTGCGFNAIRKGRWGGVVPDSETGMIGGEWEGLARELPSA